MGFGPAYGDRDSGALAVATRSDNNMPAVFADFTALTTYTATTEGTADANRISVVELDFASEVFAVGTLSGSVVATITAAYARVGTSWVSIATNIVGTAGTDGTDGTDGNTFEFDSIAERDTFFTTRFALLENDLSIRVTLPDNTLEFLVWQGGTRTSYTPATDAAFWIPASMRSGTASFELGNVHTMSSGGENVFFSNQQSEVNYFPAWQSVGDHRTSGGRTVQNRPTARVYSDLTDATPNGTAAAAGAVDYDTSLTLTQNTSVFGVSFILAEDYDDDLTIEVREATVGIVFNSVQSINGNAGDTMNIWFEYPVEGRANTTVTIQARKTDRQFLQVRPGVTDTAEPYRLQRIRTFTDVGLLYQSEYNPPQADWTEVDTSDPSYIQNKPTLNTPVASDWAETDPTDLAFIQNKPTIPTVPSGLDTRRDTLQNIIVGGFGSSSFDNTTGALTITVGQSPNDIKYDSLWLKAAGQPMSDTNELLVIDQVATTGNTQFRLVSNGTAVQMFTLTAEANKLQTLRYTLSAQTWVSIYADTRDSTINELSWEYFDGTNWINIHTFDILR